MPPSDYRRPPEAFDVIPGPAVRLEDVRQGLASSWKGRQGTLDRTDDGGERDRSRKKGVDGLLVGSVEDCGTAPAGARSLPSQANAGEALLVQGVGLQGREIRKLSRRDGFRNTVGIAEGDRDREAHVRAPELGLQRAVDELDHRVDDALRVNRH